MKDSQLLDHAWAGLAKYIKESNERFSTEKYKVLDYC